MGEVGRSSERARTIRGEDLNLVIAKNDAIAGCLADQSACDWRAVGDRPRSGISFEDPVRHPPAIVAAAVQVDRS